MTDSTDAAPAPGLIARVFTGLRYAVTGTPPADWFGPARPMTPEAPPTVAGRRFDYPVAVNLSMAPRAEECIGFAELRGLAERWDLLRLVIETRKDQIESLDWAIQPRKLTAQPAPAAASGDPRIGWLVDFLRFPDREHGWGGWLRMLLEDLFVIDAPTLHVRRDRAGGLWALEVIDGATIKRVLAADGRTPIPPDPAYQQVLKGVPAVDYTREELIYAPRNPRPHKIYGLSPVEQIVMTANIALRRQVSQLNYFTEGNTPEALIGVPDAWGPDQIRQFQDYWDALLQGNLGARRHTCFVPGGLKYQPMREPPLKDAFDEWLARVVCFAFSIPATAFSTQTNRATAETAQQAALAEGLAPLQRWLKGLIDRVITQVLGWPDLEFTWADTLPADPGQQAQILTAYVAAGIKTRNEARAQLGLDPLPAGDATAGEGVKSGLTRNGTLSEHSRDGGKTPCLASNAVEKKYDSSEPRDQSGRWASVGLGEAGATDVPFDQLAQVEVLPYPLVEPLIARPMPLPPSIDVGPLAPDIAPRESIPQNPYPDRPECAEEWREATEYCSALKRKGKLGVVPYRQAGNSLRQCIMGQVSERCGGNPV